MQVFFKGFSSFIKLVILIAKTHNVRKKKNNIGKLEQTKTSTSEDNSEPCTLIINCYQSLLNLGSAYPQA